MAVIIHRVLKNVNDKEERMVRGYVIFTGGVFAAARDVTHILKGILPICANCKKIRTDIGY